MKVVILAGGYGTRLSEETDLRPKPMVEIEQKPILWHIMKTYSHYGHNDFVILLGYKGYYIKEYFANHFLHQSDITIDLQSNNIEVHNNSSEPWKVTLLDTGIDTLTGGRVLRAKEHLKDEPFFLTYGDGVSNVNIRELLEYHKQQESMVTVTGVQPEGKYGESLLSNSDKVTGFNEKPPGDNRWVNGGFFVCEPEVFNYLEDDTTPFEGAPLATLTSEGQLSAYRHRGFWKCMDTLNDKSVLNKMWKTDQAPWKVW